MFKTQKSLNKTRSGEIDLKVRLRASPNVGKDQVSKGVSVLWVHAAPTAYDYVYYMNETKDETKVGVKTEFS